MVASILLGFADDVLLPANLDPNAYVVKESPMTRAREVGPNPGIANNIKLDKKARNSRRVINVLANSLKIRAMRIVQSQKARLLKKLKFQ